MDRFDAVVIGGGIAGVSAGYFIAERGRRVLLLEAEPYLAYHTTGRSAALFFENYGHPAIRPLSKWSKRFMSHPPTGLFDVDLLSPRGALMIAREDQTDRLEEEAEEGRHLGTPGVSLDGDQARDLVPVLGSGIVAGLWEPDAMDIDVATLHQGFARGLRSDGGEIWTSARVDSLTPTAGGWQVGIERRRVTCDVVVNAAGAWCDEIAELAGVRRVGLQPRRRTAFMVGGAENWRGWPLVHNVGDEYYFKPDGVQLLCSLSDETPSEPCDAKPVDLDIALAIERINEDTTLGIRSIRSSWAGLRTFAPDRAMVIGEDARGTGFFWLAGQGGTGIQTSPAAGRLIAELVIDGEPSAELVESGVDAASLATTRFRRPDTSP
jgi:D-arginine dehydrogenase